MSHTYTSDTDASHAGRADTRSVVVPVYDEPPATWSSLVESLLAAGWDEVVVAVDRPDAEAARAASQFDRVDETTISMSAERRGKGGAIRDGLAVADGDVVGYVDADGAVDPNSLARLYRAVESGEAAVAVGSRDADAADRDGQALHRRVLGGGYRRLARRVTGVDVTDFQCGAKAFRREVWETVGDAVVEDGFAFDTELLARAHYAGYEVTERPIDWRDPGDSDVSVARDVPGFVRSLVRLDRELPAEPTDADEPVSLALVTDHPPNYGHLAEYGEALARAYAGRDDVELTVFARQVDDDVPGDAADGDRAYDVERVWERDSAAGAWRLLRSLRAGGYDAVQFNVHMTYFGSSNAYRFLGLSLPALARLRLDCPVVTTLHDMLEVVEDERVAEDVSAIEKLGARAATQVALSADATTVTAESYREAVEERYVADGVVHVPHGTFARADGGVPRAEPPLRILQFGFLGPTKDVETTVEAFREVRAEHPDAELVIAGDSHPDYPGYREDLQERFGDEPGVRFTGYVDDDELDDVWHDASLVVMPYRTCTGVSGVFQLAKSYGKPVVAFDNDGMRTSTVETGGTASFVPPEDAEALADRLLDLWAERDRLDEMARTNAEAGDDVPMTETTERMLAAFVEHTDLPGERVEVVTGE
ncbi:glycosyltransferase [Halosimplex amylolyticum]|uniref:glycosyltransferase n=1 Tax=Halosimplex amylolyticum TaxID=3396616 RepID=UPI003F565A02